MRRPPLQSAFQELVRWTCRLGMMVFFRIRIHHLERYPAEDGFLICSNHQSHLDPVIVGVIAPRPINYVGRRTLTRFKPFGWFLYYNDLIAIDREGSGMAGLKETMRRLKLGESVLIFPEGTRTHDGEMQPIKMGVVTVARRTRSPILPIGIDGAYHSMPRSSWMIWPRRIHVVIGQLVTFAEYEPLSDEQLGEILQARMKKAFDEARQRRQRLRSRL